MTYKSNYGNNILELKVGNVMNWNLKIDRNIEPLFHDCDNTINYSEKHNTLAKGVLYTSVSSNIHHPTFMTKQGYTLLRILADRNEIFAVTARDYELFHQFKFSSFYNNYVLSNGGAVYVNREEDLEYRAIITEQIRELKNKPGDIMRHLVNLTPPVLVEKNQNITDSNGETLFVLYYIKKEFIKEFQSLIANLKTKMDQEYNILIENGNKFYFIPKFIDKSKAVNYLRYKLGIDSYIAAGDSLMDQKMLTNARVALISTAGELAKGDRTNLIKSLKDCEYYKIYEDANTSTGESILNDYLRFRS